MSASHPRVAVFDIGKVLIDWDPRLLYAKLFDDPAKAEWFHREVCTTEWNHQFDCGVSYAEGVAARIALYPDVAAEIRAYDERWLEMVPGPIEGSVAILETLRANGVPNYAITNFSAEKFSVAKAAYPFLAAFDGVIVSGEERIVKPDPAIYRLLLTRYRLDASDCVFVDDVPANVEAARAIGMQAHLFENAEGFARFLRAYGFPV